jgi:hypothetical protein
MASSHVEIAITRQNGRVFATVRGPETKATRAECPAGGDWLGIRFKLGTYLPSFAPGDLKDRHDVTLPDASEPIVLAERVRVGVPRFRECGYVVTRLVRKGILVRDDTIDASLCGPDSLPARSTQRHFLRATGITRSTARQIERARYATALLRQSVSILDTVYEAGYFDQAHLTRSLKTLIGQTPSRIAQGTQQLSFLYKTTTPSRLYDAHGRCAT